jgi:outer membrane protein OmpA-like peptidoglycan-associated protein
VGQQFATGSIRLNADGLALAPLDPLLARYAFLELMSGKVSGDAELRFGAAADPSRLRLEGDARLADFVVTESGTEARFFSFQSLDAIDMQLLISPNRIDIAEIEVVGPEAELVVSEKRTLNLSRVLRERGAHSGEEHNGGDARSGEIVPIRIGRVTMREGMLQFADLSLVLPFSTRVHQLEGVIIGLSSAPDRHAELQLEGRIADYGSAHAGGTLNTFDPTRFMDVGAKFDNVLIPPFSPYTATFAGRIIESGRLWLDLEYRIVGGELSGQNKIVVQNLKLGEQVEAPSAADLPLELAIALLKDSEGRISMEIPVSGEVGDPQFDYGQLIRDAIGTTLRRIASAPFRALASLFGGGDTEEARTVRFSPGNVRIAPAEQQQLEQIAEALQARPELQLLVQGPYDSVEDARALRQLEIRRSIAEALGRPVPRPDTPDPVAFTDPQTQEVLEALLRERLDEEDYRTFKSIIGPSDPQYYEAAYAELAARVKISESRLQELAASRAQAIADAVAAAGIAPDRIVSTEVRQVNEQPSSSIATKLNLDVSAAG